MGVDFGDTESGRQNCVDSCREKIKRGLLFLDNFQFFHIQGSITQVFF